MNLIHNGLISIILIPLLFSAGTVSPSGIETENSTNQLPDLEDVQTWFYYLDVNLSADTIEQVVNPRYDMVVLDYIPSEENNRDYPMADVIDQFHNADHPKLVLAYIDIGQAENYRIYWQHDWGNRNH